MDTMLILPLIALAFLAAFGYFKGKKKNERIGRMIASTCEKVLNPTDKTYTNIGGTIGYHFVYKLKAPFTEAKGTFTLLPRHSLMYLPISLLIRGHDSCYINLFTQKKLSGEGHLIAARHFKRIERSITGREGLSTEETSKDGSTFVILYDNAKVRDDLMATLDSFSPTRGLIHFCIYSENKTIFLYTDPSAPGFERFVTAFSASSASLAGKK